MNFMKTSHMSDWNEMIFCKNPDTKIRHYSKYKQDKKA